ncbi:hypothetical protein BGZ96_006671 [Linnemannia gamsii]|uniref:F-box domain-containing protein n=1 Tax=Linnemannia gamsii TaxID=64522 RepID=A0ABQ7K4E9_9FUNG|nr:hypothetical protein BGZ96_006671 [Linnemannia gamsii]
MESLLNLRVRPIDIPEILYHIFLHLDRPTLHNCAKEPGNTIEPQDRPIANADTTTATPATLTNLPTDGKSQGALEFERRCAGLRSLSIGDAWSGKTVYGEAFHVSEGVQHESAVPASLANLIRLDVRLVCASQPYTRKDSLPNKVFQNILAQNPLIEELFFASGTHPGYDGLQALLLYPLRHLRCLTLQLTDHAWNFLEFWIWLVQRDSLQARLRQTTPNILASLRDPVPHTQEQGAAALKALPDWNLQELTIKNANPKDTDIPFHGFMRNALWDNAATIYKLSLRSLTLEGFDMRQHGNGERQENRSVLYHLFRRLPLLERLRISPDHTKVREPSPLPVREILRASYFRLSGGGLLSAPYRLGENLVRFCLHLRAIDLSHHRELDSSHWQSVLKFYAPRLESLVCWSVGRVDSNALQCLVPASPGVVLARGPHPSQKWIGLQELDINANRECASVIPLFLKYVPTLRILRALDVPVDGAGLVEFNWACKDIEILAINLKVPTRIRARSLDPWCWSGWGDGWNSTPVLKSKFDLNYRNFYTGDGESIMDVFTRLETSSQPRMGDYEDAESESEDEITARLWKARRVTAGYKARERMRESILSSGRHRTPEDEEFLGWCYDLELKEMDEDTAEVAKWKVQNDKVKAEKDRRNKEYNVQVQQQLCEQLGRLVKLRELTLEGRRYTSRCTKVGYKKRLLFDSLHLTLETGLDYLRPLQASLEKLVVYQLDERLSGGAEVEWIAKNWVHHADPVWQHTFDTWDRQSYLDIPDKEDGNRAQYPWPKFRQLIGVDTRQRKGLNEASAAGNIAWLEYYCPELRVVGDDGKVPTTKGSRSVASCDASESDMDTDYSDGYEL